MGGSVIGRLRLGDFVQLRFDISFSCRAICAALIGGVGTCMRKCEKRVGTYGCLSTLISAVMLVLTLFYTDC